MFENIKIPTFNKEIMDNLIYYLNKTIKVGISCRGVGEVEKEISTDRKDK